MDVEAIFGNIGTDEDGALFAHDPTLQMRTRTRAAVPASLQRATQTYKAAPAPMAAKNRNKTLAGRTGDFLLRVSRNSEAPLAMGVGALHLGHVARPIPR